MEPDDFWRMLEIRSTWPQNNSRQPIFESSWTPTRLVSPPHSWASPARQRHDVVPGMRPPSARRSWSRPVGRPWKIASDPRIGSLNRPGRRKCLEKHWQNCAKLHHPDMMCVWCNYICICSITTLNSSELYVWCMYNVVGFNHHGIVSGWENGCFWKWDIVGSTSKWSEKKWWYSTGIGWLRNPAPVGRWPLVTRRRSSSFEAPGLACFAPCPIEGWTAARSSHCCLEQRSLKSRRCRCLPLPSWSPSLEVLIRA